MGATIAALTQWLASQVEQAGARGAVFGLSGGIDSAVVGALCGRALPGRSLGLIMPCHSDPRDQQDAALAAEAFALPTQVVDLGPVYDLHLANLQRCFGATGQPSGARPAALAAANLKPRLRMTALYYFANRLNYLVVGTGNRSELAVGYFTKYGDGGVDLLPLGGLVKGEVRRLAEELGVPRRIIEKPPSAGLWSGQTDEGELGLSYEELDRYLIDGAAPGAVRAKIERLSRAAGHKLRLPHMPEWPAV
ncbi:MAG: NAD(+) synthase [Chitinophagales bacterium]